MKLHKTDKTMDIQTLFAEGADVQKIIRQIRDEKKSLSIPPWSDIKNEYYPHLHRIMTDTEWWKDKETKDKSNPYKVSRITYALQMIATRRMTQMAFAIPVRRDYSFDIENAIQKAIVDALEKIYERAHIDSVNRKRFPYYFASCELLTIWYAIPSAKHEDYGFNSEYKLRCKSYSEMNGYTLYPIFDGYDDLLGMCVEYKSDEYTNGAKNEVYTFEVFTKDRHVHFKGAHDTVAIEPVVDEKIKIVKLPLAYLLRHQPLWEGQTRNNDEIELAYSRESEILRHNSAPYLHAAGKVIKKGEAAKPSTPQKPFSITEDGGVGASSGSSSPDDSVRIINTEHGGSLNYVTWDQSIEAMKFFIQELKENAEEQLQLPNLSMTKMAALGGVGYDARKTVLTDAHLKVGDESGEIILFLEREWKVLCAFLAFMAPEWKSEIPKIRCKHVITPFIQDDRSVRIKEVLDMTGGELMSRKTGIERLGEVKDVDAELEQIEKEVGATAKRNRVTDVFTAAE